ncbi:MAG: hypothetical protein K940chlam7_02091, partial [Chlamydiae bacterium]|nr:hypothetical protein [Chlamydiota bacterium]
YDKIIDLIKAGMNVARLNFSHGTREGHLKSINLLKQARMELEVPLAIMLDTRGPEVRLGEIAGDGLSLSKGDKWHLVKQKVVGNKESVSITPGEVLEGIPRGSRILFDDGYISSHVVEETSKGLIVEIDNGGVIRSGKGVNVPEVSLNLPSITEKDFEDIRFGGKHGVDIIAASFVRSAENIMTIKDLLVEEKYDDILVIAKIENHEGIENFDCILQVADGVMIARGDLGVEIPLSRVPKLQKEMIRKCYHAGKPSVTATQMLESMMYNPRPTRAEVSDVANAIYDSTSVVMLSGETAVGKYPIETVQVMNSIIKEAEEDFDYHTFFDFHSKSIYNDVPSAVALATVKTAYSSHAAAVFALTDKGATARLLSRLRPAMPILALTSYEKVYHQMAFNWGVTPVLGKKYKNFQEAFAKISEYAMEKQFVSYGDLVIVTAGSTFGVTGTTNMMIVENIGDVLVRGFVGTGDRIYGNVRLLLSTEKIKPYNVRGQLIVIPLCDESYLPYMKEAGGIILQNHIDDVASETFLLEEAKLLSKPAIARADAACNILRDGQLVTMDPEKALIYKGVVLD